MNILFFLGLSLAKAQLVEPDYVSNYGIVCLDQSCPESVGALIAVDLGSVIPNLSCSITLIDDDHVLTNSHCIPKNLRVAGAVCGPQIELSFPKISDKFAEEDVACDKVEAIGMTDAEEVGVSQNDWALLKLKAKPHRKAAVVERTALAFSQKVFAYPVFYSPFVPIGQIYQVECQVSELGYLYPSTFHPQSSLFFAKDCEFLSQVGNSGTGVWNEQGHHVGLISAMVHQKFQDAAEAASSGSPNVLGLKNLCIPVLGEVGPACQFDENDEDFQVTTILYSSLNAFEKSLQAAQLDPQQPQSSHLIRWQKATAQNVGAIFSSLYYYTNVEQAEQYLAAHNVPELANDVAEKAAQVLGQVPACATGDGADKMDYSIFNFRDFEMYPGDQGLYLHVDVTRELAITAVRRTLKVTLSQTSNQQFLVQYDDDDGEFALTTEEMTYKDSVCEQEKPKENPEKAKPSPRCIEIYKKWSTAQYLNNFSFTLPGC